MKLSKTQKRLLELKNYNKTNSQAKALANLNKIFDEGVCKPLRFGYTTNTLKSAKPYDTPRFLKNWSKDKRKKNI